MVTKNKKYNTSKKMTNINKITKKPSVVTPKKYTMHDCEYVYFIHEREFLNSNQPVYKLGKTKQWNCRRLKDYPKDSALILVWRVPNCHVTERKLIKEFDRRYKKRKDIGAEYYEGDINEMKATFINVVKLFPERPVKPSWLRWAAGGIYRGLGFVFKKIR